MKSITFLFGLPLSGKTSFYQKFLQHSTPHVYVNADDIKFEFDDYDETVEGMYKDEAIKIAKERVLECMGDGLNVVMDAGGINGKYTYGIMEIAKRLGYFITMYHIDTPYQICLERNKQRARSVPESMILEKEVKRWSVWNRYLRSGLVDKTGVIPYFTEQHLFFDMDGVLAAQTDLPVINGKIDFVNTDHFRYLPPVPQVRNILSGFRFRSDKPRELYILSAAPTSISADEKKEWLKEYYPFIEDKNIFFVNTGRYKAEMFHDLAKRLKLDKKDMCLVEDTHEIIKTVKREYGMHSLHVSEFLTKYA